MDTTAPTRKRLTLEQAAAHTRQPVEAVEAALAIGDLRSLARRDLDSWRRAVIACITTASRTAPLLTKRGDHSSGAMP